MNTEIGVVISMNRTLSSTINTHTKPLTKTDHQTHPPPPPSIANHTTSAHMLIHPRDPQDVTRTNEHSAIVARSPTQVRRGPRAHNSPIADVRVPRVAERAAQATVGRVCVGRVCAIAGFEDNVVAVSAL